MVSLILSLLQIIGTVVGWRNARLIYMNPSVRTATLFAANLLAAPTFSIVFVTLEMIKDPYETNIVFFMHPFSWVPIIYEIGFIIGSGGFYGGLIITRFISMIIR